MARKKSSAGTEKYKWVGHIMHYFNDEEIVKCVAWIEDRKPVAIEAMSVITQKEIGMKVSYNPNQDGYFISLQPKSKTSFYYGYTIGFSHSDLERLVHIALYVVAELMEHDAIPLPDKSPLPEW